MAKVIEQLKKLNMKVLSKQKKKLMNVLRKDIQRKRCADFNKLD